MKRIIVAGLVSVACTFACSTYSGLGFVPEREPVGAGGSGSGNGSGTTAGGAQGVSGAMSDGGSGSLASSGTGAGSGGSGAVSEGGTGGAPPEAEAGAPNAGADSGPPVVFLSIALSEATTSVVRTGAEPEERFHDRCPIGQVLIGVDGRLEAPGGALYLRSIQGVCGTPSVAAEAPWAVTLAESGMLPLREIDLPQTVSARCADGEVVVGFSGRSGVWVDGLNVYCAPLEVVSLGGELELSIGDASSAGYLGAKTGGSAFALQTCPHGSVAVGQTGGTVVSGDVLGELGFACAHAQLQVDPG